MLSGQNGNRTPRSGLTAGIDFVLVLLAEPLGEDVAKMTQLMLEYDPALPLDAGTPAKAGPEIMGKMQTTLGSMNDVLTPMCVAAANDMEKYMPVAN
ncbi:MAG: hypothetical protein AAF699_22065 [Pseudomonadota bacterium]